MKVSLAIQTRQDRFPNIFIQVPGIVNADYSLVLDQREAESDLSVPIFQASCLSSLPGLNTATP